MPAGPRRASLEVANRGEAGPQPVPRRGRRGACRRGFCPAGPRPAVSRERRVLFDGVQAEIHPYDVTVESTRKPEVYDCKWGARGHQRRRPESARRRQVARRRRRCGVTVALVVFDARRSCELRFDRATAERGGTGAGSARGPGLSGRSRSGARAGGSAETGSRQPRGRHRAVAAAGRTAADAAVVADFEDRLPYRIVRPYRVRFEESTASETMRTAIYLAWVADIAWQHSTALGFGRDWYSERGLYLARSGRAGSTSCGRSRRTPRCSSPRRSSAIAASPLAAKARFAIRRASWRPASRSIGS